MMQQSSNKESFSLFQLSCVFFLSPSFYFFLIFFLFFFLFFSFLSFPRQQCTEESEVSGEVKKPLTKWDIFCFCCKFLLTITVQIFEKDKNRRILMLITSQIFKYKIFVAKSLLVQIVSSNVMTGEEGSVRLSYSHFFIIAAWILSRLFVFYSCYLQLKLIKFVKLYLAS